MNSKSFEKLSYNKIKIAMVTKKFFVKLSAFETLWLMFNFFMQL